ncbi:MAG: hypothetical protein EAY69_05635 [Cytophagales bacterium]|nr:MAG: hypothetical protein EAY69_05635 [Cytophagales bacterium]
MVFFINLNTLFPQIWDVPFFDNIALYHIKKLVFEDVSSNSNIKLFNEFYENIELKIDNVQPDAFWLKYNFTFVKVRSVDLFESINIKKTLYQNYSFDFKHKIMCDDEYYLLAIDNDNTNNCIRLKGFDNLDLHLLFKKLSNTIGKKIKKKHLKDYKNDLFDIYCFYEAWKNHSYDTLKYPCLKPCLQELTPVIRD